MSETRTFTDAPHDGIKYERPGPVAGAESLAVWPFEDVWDEATYHLQRGDFWAAVRSDGDNGWWTDRGEVEAAIEARLIDSYRWSWSHPEGHPERIMLFEPYLFDDREFGARIAEAALAPDLVLESIEAGTQATTPESASSLSPSELANAWLRAVDLSAPKSADG